MAAPGRDRRAGDIKRAVARAYDQIAERFLEKLNDQPSDRFRGYLERALDGHGTDARILDLGCGAGLPFTRWLSQRARVLAVDISRGQLALARRNAPDAALLQADMATLQLRPASFDAITALYSIIHVPREEQQGLLERMRAWLRPGGRLLAVFGGSDWEGSEDDWLGLGATMHWSHFAADAYGPMLERAGFRIVTSAIEPDNIDDSGGFHLFVIAEAP